ncbi:Fatty acid desaturase [Gordonia westfalica]|uniref:Fatty acid desaturase n=1 Tax=Gordonia westfalica TaxID=158898 RepID=A0A1H2I698_9ACTN|nr:fatty acid desaturase [Gordonia westfalica]SDU39663.1 Fatty acid desaturase [Gordonia westfalica]
MSSYTELAVEVRASGLLDRRRGFYVTRMALTVLAFIGCWTAVIALGDNLVAGLNYQIEHHLFPSMPRPNLIKVRPLVRAHCERHGVQYTETSLVASYGIVIRYLNQVGLGDRDPFTCPLVRMYR